MVVIAYNHAGKVVSIVNAKSEELAKVFWHGQSLNYDHARSLDDSETFMPLSEHPTGVYPILQTIEVVINKWSAPDKDTKYLCVK